MRPLAELGTAGNSPMAGKRAFAAFSVLELVVVLAIGLVLTAMTVPGLYQVSVSYRVSGAASGLAMQLALARLSAAGQFTHAQVAADTLNQNYAVQIWNKTTNSWATDQGGTQYLPSSVVFGYPADAPPAGSQAAIGETTPISFDSRGMNLSSAVPSALYIQDSSGRYAYAVVASVIGKVNVYRYDFSRGQWVRP